MSDTGRTTNYTHEHGKLRSEQTPKLKSSSLERIPVEWEMKDLSQILDVIRGFAFESSDYLEFGILNFRVSNVDRPINDIGNVQYLPETFFDKFPKQQLAGGEIVIVMVGATTGKLGRVPSAICPALMNQNMWNLVPKNGINRDYLWHLLPPAVNRHMQMSQGSARDFLKQSEFNRTVVSGAFSNPDEQAKIAEVLSTVDQAIEQTEALIAKQQRIKTGLMQDLLTRGIDEHGNLRSEQTHEFKDSPLGRIPVEWEIGGFENYVISEAGIKPGPFGSSLTKDIYVEAGYRVYGQEQVIGGTLDIGDYFITGRKYSEMYAFAVKEGDVLISLVGTIGHVLIVPHRYHPGVINPRLLRFRPDPRHCVPQFLKALLLSQPVRLQLDTFATGGTMPVLSGGILRQLRVVIFGLNEQKRIIQIIEGSEAALLSSSTHLAKLRSLKTGLMQDLLTGKKRVTALLNDTEVSA